MAKLPGDELNGGGPFGLGWPESIMPQDFYPPTASEAAAMRIRNSVRPPWRGEGAATELVHDMVIPQSPLDWALLATGGPMGRLAKVGAIAAGAALESTEANAGWLSRAIKASGLLPARKQGLDPGMYPTPSRPPRPFEADYPPDQWPSVPTNSRGGLLKDTEGRDLYAKYVVGRRLKDGPDEVLGTKALDDMLDRTGARLSIVGPDHSTLRGVKDATYNQNTGEIFVSNTLSREDRYRAIVHEFLHHFENRAGKIPMTRRMRSELKPIYSAQALGREDLPRSAWFLPEDSGYGFWKRDAELKAEGLRAYFEDPNFFKTMAPESAAAFRAAFNANKDFSPHIQLNSLILPALGGAVAAAVPPPAATPPFFPDPDGL